MEASKSVSAKQLKDHLQHQQEPFSLHNYLSERRFFLKNFSPDIDDHLPSEKNLKRWINHEKHKIRKRFLHASSILRSRLYKFIPFGDHQNQKLSNWSAIEASHSDHCTKEDGENGGLNCHDYSPKLVNMFHSFTLPKLRRLEVDAGSNSHWISTVGKHWEQPLSKTVCEFKGGQGPGTAIYTLSQKSVGDHFFSTYLPKVLLNPNILKFRRPKRDKLHNIVGTPPIRHRNKRTLHRRKQHLLFGGVEKAREFQENNGKRERICSLEKRHREAEKVTHLLHAESCVVSEEWTNLHKPSTDIHFEVGDAIMDDIVRDMLYILLN